MTITSLIGGVHTLHLGNETLEFKPITLDVEAEFEQRLFARTRASIAAMKKDVSPDEYIKLLQAITESYALGKYRLLSPNGVQALQTIEGLVILTSILTGKSEKDLPKIIREHGAEFGSTLGAVLQDSLGVEIG